ncbi:TIM barrel protein [Methylobacterium nonmethylotrophicum]|uniref:Hydroxypyruvate isomerase n=1 Tax=Methylobacterium nonmethylotrophicum TaxID=1141884 RepID=A0A4Z0NG09_9HYPH|nr:TIM barrel protein [Methylobacterium nonmethylotrophicum]TGD95258.1 hydroxypyruvate isomerase [Methylobacterium nonmethylotrophicum]
MPKLAPNLYHQFLELPARERFGAARRAGFDAIEWHFPYEIPIDDLKLLLDDNGLTFVNAVTPVDWSVSKGLAAQPGREDEFRRAADLALRYAFATGLRTLHPGPGQIPPGIAREHCIDVLRANLDYLCEQARGSDLVIAIEGVSNARFPNMVLQTIADAAAVAADLDRPNLGIIYDTFHLRHEEKGPLSAIYERHKDRIAHIQIGNAPPRHEPGVGEIDLFFLMDHFDRDGYSGWIGLEYDPSRDTWSSLRWAERYGYRIGARPAA